MATPIPIPFFGRREELAALEARCASRGLTIVKGPPKIGKTTLLRHFVKKSRAAGSCRMGWAESGEASGDVLLRAIKDAYDNWITEDGDVARIKSIHAQIEGKLVTTVGPAFGKALAEFTGPAKGLVKLLFTGLDEARRAAETGGVQLTRLSSAEARDLLAILVNGQTAPVVVALNQWEEGQDLGKDIGVLRDFLPNMGDWPNLHILLHLRDPRFRSDRNQQAKDLAGTLSEFPGVRTVEVGEIDFAEDHAAYAKLMDWLAKNFPAFASTDGGDHLAELALEEIAGNPAVLSEWAHTDEADRASLERLAEVAANARAMQYPELRVLYRRLLDEAKADPARVPVLEVAMLAAVLPLPPDAEDQASVLPAVLGDATNHDLTRLESDGLLRPEGGPPLSVGHPSRREAAERCVMGLNEQHEAMDAGLAAGLRPYVRGAVKRVIPALVELHPPEAWRGLEPEVDSTILIIALSSDLPEVTGAGNIAALLCASVLSLFPDAESAMPIVDTTVFERKAGPSTRMVCAMGLCNAIFGCSSDFTRADGLLGEMRKLSRAHPGDLLVRGHLAMGLFDAFFHSKAESQRADGLLGDLQELAKAHPDDVEVRSNLAKGLFNAFNRSEATSPRADGMLDRMRRLTTLHPEDSVARESLAKGLFNAFFHCKAESRRAQDLLDELRRFACAHLKDTAVQELFASGLSNAIAHCGSNLGGADELLGELGDLAEVNQENTAFRNLLAVGIFNAFGNCEANSLRANGLLRDLRGLSENHKDETALRENPFAAYGVPILYATAAGEVNRVAELAEALVPLRDAVHRKPDIRPLFRQVFAAALELAVEKDDEDASKRLTAASKALFDD